MNFADYDGEAVLNAGPTCLAAVRSDGERVRLFLDGDPAINVFRNTGSLNIPQPKVTFDPVERRFGFAASFSTKSTRMSTAARRAPPCR